MSGLVGLFQKKGLIPGDGFALVPDHVFPVPVLGRGIFASCLGPNWASAILKFT